MPRVAGHEAEARARVRRRHLLHRYPALGHVVGPLDAWLELGLGFGLVLGIGLVLVLVRARARVRTKVTVRVRVRVEVVPCARPRGGNVAALLGGYTARGVRTSEGVLLGRAALRGALRSARPAPVRASSAVRHHPRGWGGVGRVPGATQCSAESPCVSVASRASLRKRAFCLRRATCSGAALGLRLG